LIYTTEPKKDLQRSHDPALLDPIAMIKSLICIWVQISLLEVGDTDQDGRITITEWLALWQR
jgi:hypothetical protein